MDTPQPRNLFTTASFLSLASGLLIASTPNIADIVKNGGTVEKYLYLVAAVLSGAGVTSEKMRKEQELYTPNWFPVGQNRNDAIAATAVTPDLITIATPQIVTVPFVPEVVTVPVVPQVITIPLPVIVQPKDQTLETVQTILNDTQTVLSITQNPLNLLKLL